MPHTHKEPIVVIVGPTASGKSDLAIMLAREIGGEIISADSRQVFRGMDIGTGKVTREERRRVRHHLIDIAHPNTEYNVSHFLKDAATAIADIEARDKRVIICGGTLFWIEALLFGLTLPAVAPDKAFRDKWGVKDVGELYGYLKRLDPERAKTIDRKNKVRLLRALEVARALGKVPMMGHAALPDLSRFLVIGLNPPVEELNQKIRDRLRARLKAGMVKEAARLWHAGTSLEHLASFGLEYRALAAHLQEKVSLSDLEQTIAYDNIHYAKRQRSFLRRLEKRGVKIHWVKNVAEALAVLK
jgi:tRNA dimethylallyltransferase